MSVKMPTQERVGEWHTEHSDYDYRYHYPDGGIKSSDHWWVEYRDKREGKDGHGIK